jgi:hypothetical protein
MTNIKATPYDLYRIGMITEEQLLGFLDKGLDEIRRDTSDYILSRAVQVVRPRIRGPERRKENVKKRKR